jgi:glycosyltransferase involved in cell wall biosynthesis
MSYNVLVVTPVLPPAPGGAATYTMILGRGLLLHGVAGKVVLLSEGHPQRPRRELLENGHLVMERAFPIRAGRTTKDALSYFAYAITQLLFVRLPAYVVHYDISAIIIHSSFFYHSGLAQRLVRWARRRIKIPIVLDVRDPLAPARLFATAGEFDAVIACSQRIATDLAAHPAYRDRIRFIPIPIEPIEVDEDSTTATLARYGLERGGYLFNANGISRQKGIELLIETGAELRERGSGLPIIVAGRERDLDASVASAIGQGILRSLGPIPHHDVLCLARGSAAVVNPSAIETPSRTAIEALMVGARVLLPPNVPEFEAECTDWICATEPARVATQIEQLIARPFPRYRYDLRAHHPDRVVPCYGELLAQLNLNPHLASPA